MVRERVTFRIMESLFLYWADTNDERVVLRAASKCDHGTALSSLKIEVRGRQQMRTKSGLGDIILADGPNSKTQAHMDIMIYYVRN